MISLEFNNEKIIKEKEAYTLIDAIQRVGGSNTTLGISNGRVRVQNKRLRDDGHITRYAMSMIVDYEERNILRNMFLGVDKTSLDRPIILTINEGNKRDTICAVIDIEEVTSYEESEVIENIGVSNQSRYNEEYILYKVQIIVQKIYN